MAVAPHATQQRLQRISEELLDILKYPIDPEDAIHLCGASALSLIHPDPDEVLELARLQLNASPFSKVPTCWRRLFEEASLYKASSGLFETSRQSVRNNSAISSEDWLADVVKVLDTSLITAGAPGREKVFAWLFQQLQDFVPSDEIVLNAFPTTPAPTYQTRSPIARAGQPLSFSDFQTRLSFSPTPVIIPGTMTHWPAIERWPDPNYLMRMTIGGRRLVPVELGSSYIDADWTQKTMPFREWCLSYLVDEGQATKGYLAQHDLFQQIPGLKKDIAVPDYCYTTPPEPTGAAALTFGLPSIETLDEPIANAWIGPKGTKTPLHTDAYHNILCQVFGHKYVRLYAPEHTKELCPLGTDDKGIDMSNTSSLAIDDVSLENVPYVDGILSSGECLYIPLGWWHYVESISVSASVSFWWN